MADDIEVGVKLVPDESAIEDIEDREVDVGGGRGGDGRGGTGGLAAVGALVNPVTAVLAVLTAILSQLRSVQQFTGGIFRTIERKLAPLFASLIQLFRPTFSKILDSLSNFGISNAISSGLQNLATRIENLVNTMKSALGIDTAPSVSGPGTTPSQQELESSPGVPTGQAQPTQGTQASRPDGVAPFFKDAIDSFNPKTADRHDEEKKDTFANAFGNTVSEKTGGGRTG